MYNRIVPGGCLTNAHFVRAFQASAEIGQWSLLAQTVREWRVTAAVYADPGLAEQLIGPLGDDLGAWEAWVVLTERPTTPENPYRQHRLRGQLGS